MNGIDLDKRPDIDYPCDWIYKVIGRNEDALTAAIASIMGDHAYDLQFSHRSSKGNLVSMSLSIRVANEDERLGFFKALCDADDIIQVL